MKQGFWIRDWFAGLAICILIIGLSSLGSFKPVERMAYDMGLKASSRTPSDKIAIIAIDDESIASLGRWPWSRSIHARIHDVLSRSGASIIAQTTFFFDPQIDPGLQTIDKLLAFYENSSLSADYSKFSRRLSGPLKYLDQDLQRLGASLKQAQVNLNSDRILSRSIANTGNILLAMHFTLGSSQGSPETLPDAVNANALRNVVNNPQKNPMGLYPLPSSSALYPIPSLAEAANGIGALVSHPDPDGTIRSEPLVINYYNRFFPSLSLLLAARSMGLANDDIRVLLGEGIELGRIKINTDPQLQMNTFFYSDALGKPAFSIDSFHDVLEGNIPTSKYQGKIVLIGSTATGVGNSMITPIDASMAPVLTLAHSVSSILNQDFFIEPTWAQQAQWAIFALLAFYIIILLPRMSAGISATLSTILLVALIATHFVLMTKYSLWLPLMGAVILLISGHLLLTTKRHLLTEKGHQQLHKESAESNRMLGLSLQGQGQLDAAFDKFRKLPPSKESLEVLYNLALDFERKRQFNKAVSVYLHIMETDSRFRDTKARLKRAQEMENSVILGTSGHNNGGLVKNKSGVEKPMLGRYEVEKELGKGAMGAVYLGKDPKIGRVVAIKTMALSQEFEEDELDDVKQRFFREAETAGRLSHPNIVTIYDAGEEHDLAYIAMEFIQGSDMLQYCKPDTLLPVKTVLSIIMRAADALDFAHKQNVVHRDIKPANLMYEADTDTLKITDFGIARITDSSKTKTGMVLGTPSYMSPEQLAGKKVDGRTDLFSLGVMMFQMLTGRLPFQGESMAALMYKIANETHPSPDSIRPDLPRCISIIINRALAKDRDKRYKTGAQMAADLRKCTQIINKARKA